MNNRSRSFVELDRLIDSESKGSSTFKVIDTQNILHIIPRNHAELEAQLEAVPFHSRVGMYPFYGINIFEAVAQKVCENGWLMMSDGTPLEKILAAMKKLEKNRGLSLPSTLAFHEVLEIVENFPANRMLTFCQKTPIAYLVILLPHLKPGVKVNVLRKDKAEALLMVNAMGADTELLINPETSQWEADMVRVYQSRPAVKMNASISQPIASSSTSSGAFENKHHVVRNLSMPIKLSPLEAGKNSPYKVEEMLFIYDDVTSDIPQPQNTFHMDSSQSNKSTSSSSSFDPMVDSSLNKARIEDAIEDLYKKVDESKKSQMKLFSLKTKRKSNDVEVSDESKESINKKRPKDISKIVTHRIKKETDFISSSGEANNEVDSNSYSQNTHSYFFKHLSSLATEQGVSPKGWPSSVNHTELMDELMSNLSKSLG